MKRLLQLTTVLLIVTASCLAFTLPVMADDFELQEVMTGNASGLYAQVNGSGEGYYGNSLRVTFANDTGQDYRVKVPIGLRLIPTDSSVQTMYTAGGESLSVPPGNSSYLIKGFCGEAHDSGPGSSDTFTPGGFADGDLMRTLEEINRQESFNSDGQQAVWHHTDGNDISGNDVARDLAGGGNSVSPGEAAAAGGAAAGTAVIGVIVNNLLNGGGGSGGGGGTSTQTTTDESGPGPDDDLGDDDDLFYDPEDEFVGPPGGGFEESPPPPEDDLSGPDAADTTYEPRTGARPPLSDTVNLRTPPPETTPPELKPPIDIADVPPPEDPGDGIMIAGNESFFDKFLDALHRGGNTPAEAPPTRPKVFGPPPPKDEGGFEQIWRWLKGGHDSDVDYEGSRKGGKIIRDKGVFGSGGGLQKPLSDPVKFSQTGEGDTKALIDQLRTEINEERGSTAWRWTRRLQNLKSVTNKKVGPGGTTRDWSGVPDFLRDFAEPDVKNWAEDHIPVIKKDKVGLDAMFEFKKQYGDFPDSSKPAQREAFENIMNRLKGKWE